MLPATLELPWPLTAASSRYVLTQPTRALGVWAHGSEGKMQSEGASTTQWHKAHSAAKKAEKEAAEDLRERLGLNKDQYEVLRHPDVYRTMFSWPYNPAAPRLPDNLAYFLKHWRPPAGIDVEKELPGYVPGRGCNPKLPSVEPPAGYTTQLPGPPVPKAAKASADAGAGADYYDEYVDGPGEELLAELAEGMDQDAYGAYM